MGQKCRKPIREPGTAAFVSFRLERVQAGGDACKDRIVATAQSTNGHLQSPILVKEEQSGPNPLRLGCQKRRREGFAATCPPQNKRVADRGFSVWRSGFMKVEAIGRCAGRREHGQA